MVRKLAPAALLGVLVALVAAPSAFASGSWRFTSSDHTSIAIDWATDNGQDSQYEVFTLTEPVASASCGPGNPGVIGQPDGNPDQFECHGTPKGEVTATTSSPMACGDQVQNKDSFDGSTYTPQTPIGPGSDNCNSNPPVKSCDELIRALAQAQAQLATDRAALAKTQNLLALAKQSLGDALKQLQVLGASGPRSGAGLVLSNDLEATLDAATRAGAEVDALKAVVAAEAAAVAADEQAVAQATQALQACEGESRELETDTVTASSADCGTQAKELGAALGKERAYRRLVRLFSRVHVDKALKKLRAASAKLDAVEPAAGGRSAKLKAAIRKLVSSLDRLGGTLAKVGLLQRGFPGKAAAAQKQATVEAKALDACENPPLTLQLSHTYTTGSPQLLYLCGKLTGPANESGQIDVAAPSGAHAKGPFAFKADGSAGFNVRIVETGTFTVTVTAGSATITQTYAVPGSSTPQGPFACV